MGFALYTLRDAGSVLENLNGKSSGNWDFAAPQLVQRMEHNMESASIFFMMESYGLRLRNGRQELTHPGFKI